MIFTRIDIKNSADKTTAYRCEWLESRIIFKEQFMFVAIIIIGIVVFFLVTYWKKLKQEREKERYQQ